MKTLHRLQIHLLAIGLAAATGTVVAQQVEALSAPQVRAQLEAQGYTDIDDLKFDDGMWKAEAKGANGEKVDVRIDPRTGQVYPDDQVPSLGEDDIRARLALADYSNVHDVEFDDGLWKAEGKDRSGRDVELRLDPETGEIVGKKKD
ncbi:MAG: PepSY domain-containing protein [Luteimonas sp.]|nr:PepSY domain-containing protein [Luteimonas sp.]